MIAFDDRRGFNFFLVRSTIEKSFIAIVCAVSTVLIRTVKNLGGRLEPSNLLYCIFHRINYPTVYLRLTVTVIWFTRYLSSIKPKPF